MLLPRIYFTISYLFTKGYNILINVINVILKIINNIRLQNFFILKLDNIILYKCWIWNLIIAEFILTLKSRIRAFPWIFDYCMLCNLANFFLHFLIYFFQIKLIFKYFILSRIKFGCLNNFIVLAFFILEYYI